MTVIYFFGTHNSGFDGEHGGIPATSFHTDSAFSARCVLLFYVLVERRPAGGVGAYTDVVIRSLRADGTDLQSGVHEEMRRHWGRYPQNCRLTRPDPNIDHWRVPNLTVFSSCHAKTLPIEVNIRTLPTWHLYRPTFGLPQHAKNFTGDPQLGPCRRAGCPEAMADLGALSVSQIR